MDYSATKALLMECIDRDAIRALAKIDYSLECEIIGLYYSYDAVLAAVKPMLIEAIDNEYVEPETTTEGYLCDITANFFSLGEHNGRYALIYHG